MFNFDSWRHERRLRRAARQMGAARRRGLGLFLHEWHVDSAAPTADELEVLLESILAWCRQTIGECRRPWGIDHFDLTLARSGQDGAPAFTLQLRDLRPLDLYAAGPMNERLCAFLAPRGSLLKAAPQPVQIAAALFSWGNAADAAFAS